MQHLEGQKPESLLSGATLTVGVIIPVFNSGREAFSGILSVMDQTNVSIQEIVVVDDGSTDDSAEFLREACRDLAIPLKLYRTLNGGAANARNHGMENCSCDLYAFLDSDDKWSSNKLALQLPFFKDSSVGMVACRTTMGKGGPVGFGRYDAPRTISLRHQLFKNHFQTSTVVVRRSVVEDVGRFPVDQRHAEEGDFFNRIAASYKCLLLPEVLVDYGCGKHGFGASGLSANLFAMEMGELRNILRVYYRGECGFVLFILAFIYSLLKFARRVLLTYLRRLHNFF